MGRMHKPPSRRGAAGVAGRAAAAPTGAVHDRDGVGQGHEKVDQQTSRHSPWRISARNTRCAGGGLKQSCQ